MQKAVGIMTVHNTANPVQLYSEAERTLDRIQPRLDAGFKAEIAADPKGWQFFKRRLHKHFPYLFALYFNLYSRHYDFFFHIEDLLTSLARAWFARPADLRELDQSRELDPHWFQSNHMLGGVCYVDLFAGDIEGVRSKIPYFKELGLTYLHLMPLFKSPRGENDGGYAVSSYREVSPSLGTMGQLSSLAGDLRSAGISLVLDLVFNHTSDEHLWAQQAKAGDTEYQNFYRIFPDRSMPDAYERNLREIFPDEHPGAFTFNPEMGKWVWTTFHSYQWDLNYDNPSVCNRMIDEILFLANQGVEVLRLDAVAFIWKQLGTNCENLPEAHTLIQAFNASARIAAPTLLFKSEAIVHPEEVVKYIDPQECQLSYNPLIMALLWNSLATRKIRLLSRALDTRFKINSSCAWVNYVRSHDDIGWTFSDEDAALLGINGHDHRHFLNEFYRGRFPGSFARGLPFQEDPRTGDCRISGTCASLAGMEKALNEEGDLEVELAVRRILLIHGIILSLGGIPLIYLGDEIATLNDYTYRNDPAKAHDSRWVHRSRTNFARYSRRDDPMSTEGRVYRELQALITLRKNLIAFYGSTLEIIHTDNDHVLSYIRKHSNQCILIFANFSESSQVISAGALEQYHIYTQKTLYGRSNLPSHGDLILAPLDLLIVG